MENVRERERHMQWYSEKTEKKIHTYIYIHTHTHTHVCVSVWCGYLGAKDAPQPHEASVFGLSTIANEDFISSSV